jgi:hypothetical protein
MTEAEWLACNDPQRMLEPLGSRASTRKLWMFACASLRRVWHLLLRQIEDWQPLVELVERYADRQASKRHFRAWSKTLRHPSAETHLEEWRDPFHGARGVASYAADRLAESAFRLQGGAAPAAEEVRAAATDAAKYAAVAAGKQVLLQRGEDLPMEEENRVEDESILAEGKAQAALLRCLFGNPFRPLTLDPAWRTPTICSLAQAGYEQRQLPSGHLDPARLTVLADALEEAGCTDPATLGHLRGPGSHARGCWVLDLLLGKE